jgi:hypothetical protein
MELTERTSRRLRIGFTAAWMGCLFVAARATATAHDTHPEHLLGLLPIAYMAAWAPLFLLSRSSRFQTAARFLVCTASIAACLGAFELLAVFGGVDYRAVFSTPTPPWRRPGNRPDPELLYVKQGPSRTRLEFRGAELSRLRGGPPGRVYCCDVHLDCNGFRNPTETASADVVVIGDSFIEGLQVDESELVTTRLSELLGKRVANLGRTSYGPQQELHVLRRYGLSLSPRTCIWAFYEGNDLQDLNAYEAESANIARILSPDPARMRYECGFVRNALGYVLRSWIHPDPGLPARLYSGRLVNASGPARELYFATGVQHGEGGPRLPRGEETPEVQRLLHVLEQAEELCRRQGMDLVVAYVPAKFRVYRDFCRFSPDSPCLNWPIDGLAATLERAIHRRCLEVGFVDLTPAFIAAASAGSMLYLADDTHWSAEGHRLAAQVLADCLKRRSIGASLAIQADPEPPVDCYALPH